MRIQPSPRRALQPNRPKVEIPKDEGSHPEAKTEWWYLNGHLEDDQNRTYGIMHTLFDMPDAINGRYNVDLPLMPGVTALDTGLTRETRDRRGGRSERSRLYGVGGL